MPSILVIVISWVSFWINIEAIPARVSIGLLTVLTMTTQSSGARGSLPKVSYIKAIDVWMSTCLIFVFAGLLEFALVNIVSRSKKKEKANDDVEKQPLNGEVQMSKLDKIMMKYCNSSGPKPEGLSEKEAKRRATKIDEISRKIFPATFVVFNLVYWVTYTL